VKALVLLGVLSFVVGCGDLPCVEDLEPSCTPLSADVSFSNVYSVVIAPGCAQAGTSCHSAEGVAGGLSLGDEQTAWEQLVDDSGGEAFALPGDPACSEVLKRMESDDTRLQMPQGAKMSDPERCMVQLWIEGGAER